ncbi:MAG: hypothetical protein AAF720_09170 [Pseudomonadota bacterium]
MLRDDRKHRSQRVTERPRSFLKILLLSGLVFLYPVSASAADKEKQAESCAADDIDCRVVKARAAITENAKRIGRSTSSNTEASPVSYTSNDGVGRKPKTPRTSVYDDFGHALYIRGGALLTGHVTNGDIDTLGFTGSIGYRKRLATNGRSSWWFQPEFLYLRDRGVDDPTLEFPVETIFTGRAGILSLRWAYDGGYIMPFLSVGAGPASLNTQIDDTLTVVDTSFIGVGYSASAGFETEILDSLYFETAYRFLGIVRDEAFGFHTAEIGLNYRF